MNPPRVYIIIVNYNGWCDTIECLESLLRLDYPNFRIVIVDNASRDRSLDRIVAWAEGSCIAESQNSSLAWLTSPPIPKPVKYAKIVDPEVTSLPEGSPSLIIVQGKSNLGFAGACNAAMRLGIATGDMDYVWLLNNDTVVTGSSLSHMIRRIEESPDAGICGSTLLYYDRPNSVQALGGATYNRWTSSVNHIGAGTDYHQAPGRSDVEASLSYIVGASMLVSRRYIERVGLLTEDYFIYFEEVDWVARARGQFRLVYSPDAIVYHKEGTTIGANVRTGVNAMSAFFTTRNRIILTARYFPFALISTLGFIFLLGAYWFARGKWSNCAALARGVGSGLRFSIARAIGPQP